MAANDQIKAFIDRVIRLKEEQDELGSDIRDIYAEAKAMGYDKTAMGEVVAYLRKVEKKGRDAVAERGAIFDMYLEAYERPSHTHAREDRSDAGLNIVTKHTEITASPGTAEEACRASQDAAPVAGRPAEPANSLPTEGCGYAHTEGNATQSGVTAGETATIPAGSSSGKASDFGSEDAGSIPAPASKPKVSFRPNCQHPENCASGTRDHCWSCRRAMQKSEEMA